MATSNKHLLLAACGSEPGMIALQLDPADGSLEQVGSCPEIAEANFVVPDPKGRGAWLFYDEPGVTDRPSGMVSFLRPGQDGLWSCVHRMTTSGSTPCFGSATPDSQELWVAHFRDLKPNPAGKGSLAVIGLESDASPAKLLGRFEHEGAGIHPDRQTNSHPHCAVVHPAGRFVAVCDLGNDRLFVYDRSGPEPKKTFELPFPDLTGPRHGAFNLSGDRFHLMTEISNTLHSLRFDPSTGRMELLSSCHVGDGGPDAPHSGADLAVSPDGRTVFASLRAENRIAIVRDGQYAGAIEDGIANPRSIALCPQGRWLVAGNLSASTVSVYDVAEASAPTGPVFQQGRTKACCLAFAPEGA